MLTVNQRPKDRLSCSHLFNTTTNITIIKTNYKKLLVLFTG